jgi:hypothetical protein
LRKLTTKSGFSFHLHMYPKKKTLDHAEPNHALRVMSKELTIYPILS